MKTRGAWRRRYPMLANAVAAAIAAALIAFGVYGALRDDFAFRVGSRHHHFNGAAAWLLSAGFILLGVSVALALWRRLAGGRTEQPLSAVMLAMAGAFIILAMLMLGLVGLV